MINSEFVAIDPMWLIRPSLGAFFDFIFQIALLAFSGTRVLDPSGSGSVFFRAGKKHLWCL